MLRKLALFAIFLTLCLMLVGAYQRISEAGLVCPGWPVCGDGAAAQALASHLSQTGHRYLAAGLMLVLLATTVLAFRVHKRRGWAIGFSLLALGLVVAEMIFGIRATPSHAQPLIMLGHLLAGVVTLWLVQGLYLVSRGAQPAPNGRVRGLRWLSGITLLVYLVDTLLGGWVASSYAALACPDFPTCLGTWWPEADFAAAFSSLAGPESHDGNLPSQAARVAIQFMHRVGSLCFFVVATLLALGVTSNQRIPHLSKAGLLLNALLLFQVVCGVGIVLWHLSPLLLLGHQLFSALILLNLVHIHYFLGLPPRQPTRVAEKPAAVVRPPEAPAPVVAAEAVAVAVEPAPIAPPSTDGLFNRLRGQLGKTRGSLTGFLAAIPVGRKTIDRELLDDIETRLLMADVGVTVTQDIISHLTANLDRHELDDVTTLRDSLRTYLQDTLEPVSSPLRIEAGGRKPFVILVVGVNGAGKTTTIGKLARRLQDQGKSVMLAAGDTFRAAAVEQLQTWGERNNVPVIAQHTGADSASVIYDAVQAAQARGVDVLIADTAGRLHTRSNLMDELSKIKRIMARLDDTAPHEVLLVLDAGTGQNALSQARLFNEAVGLTGIVLTKLDGTAKGGIIFALARQLGVPIRYIGIGEAIDDLQDFDARSFVDALFAE